MASDSCGRCFRQVLQAFVSPDFQARYIRQPTADTPLHPYIFDDPKLFPFFRNCIGAMDGTHVRVRPPPKVRARYRDRDGNTTQNILAACDFNMLFIFVFAGFEGSASDSQIFEHAIARGDLRIPEGKFYLADAGFPICDGLLVPYRAVRYHLREWEEVGNR